MSLSVRRVLRNILVIAVVLIGGFVLFLLASGAKGFAVTSDSMAPRFRRGDVVFLATGDIVSAEFPDKDGVFTHRIVGIDAEKRQIRTRGDHTLSEDPLPTDEAHIIGRLWFTLPYVGFLAIGLQNRILIYFLLGVAIMLILVRIVLSNRKSKSRGV